MDWDNQFREDVDERNARLRKARLAARCQHCGVGNDRIGAPHAATCPAVQNGQPVKEPEA